jgi:deoxyribodipyrimidine photo-lyase
MNTVIWWLRRDLRLTDNQALAHALAHAEQVIPAFVFDPGLPDSPYGSAKRLGFLLRGLRQLAVDFTVYIGVLRDIGQYYPMLFE